MGTARRATGMLILVTILWGLSFPLMKVWQNSAGDCPGGEILASFTLIAVRMILGVLVLGIIKPRLLLAPTHREHAVGALIGVVFLAGFALQVIGLATVTPALSAFFTCLGSAWTPLLAFAFLGIRVSWLSLLGLSLGMVGAAVLGWGNEGEVSWGLGHWLTLLGSVAFAVEILLLDRLGRTVESAHISVSFFATTGLIALAMGVIWAIQGPGLSAWIAWTGSMLQNGRVLTVLLILTVLSTVMAFHWMNVYQPRIPASRAALIYLLEPVFGSIFSICMGLDPLSLNLVIGGGLILGGNFLVELPGWLRRRNPT